MNTLWIYDEDTSEIFVDHASATVSPDGNFAEPLLPVVIVILIQHVIEVLLNFVQVEEYAKIAIFHLQNDFID